MAIFRAILDDVIEKYTQFKPSDDLSVPEDFIANKIHVVRTMLISQLAKQGRLDDSFYQRVCCLDIECEMQGCTIEGEFFETGNLLYRVELPELITDIGLNKNIRFLGANDWVGKFNSASLDKWRTNEHHPLLANNAIYTQLGKYALLKNLITPGMKKVCGALLLVNPLSACNYDELVDNYPCPDQYKLSLLVVKDMMSTGIKPDILQDASDTPVDPKQLQAQQQAMNKSNIQ
jgi:hypothetical protein